MSGVFNLSASKNSWTTDQTRADLSFDELLMSIMQNCATVNEVKYINKMVQQLKGLSFGVKFRKIPGDKWYLTVFSDASLKNLPPSKTGSALGYLIFLSAGFKAGLRSICCPLAWKANKIKRVVKSTHEAEALALADAVEEAYVIKKQIMEMTGVSDDMMPIEVFCDSQDAVASFNSSKPSNKGGRLQIDIARVRGMMEENIINSIHLVNTNTQLADALTKKGAAKTALISTLEEGRFFY